MEEIIRLTEEIKVYLPKIQMLQTVMLKQITMQRSPECRVLVTFKLRGAPPVDKIWHSIKLTQDKDIRQTESAGHLYLHLPKNQILLRQTWINEGQAPDTMRELTLQIIMPHLSSLCTSISNKCNIAIIISPCNSNRWVKSVLLAHPRLLGTGIMEIWVLNLILLKPHKRWNSFNKIRLGKQEGVIQATMPLVIISQRLICHLGQRNSPLASIQWLENLALLRG